MTANEAFACIRVKTGFTGPLWITQSDHQTQDRSIASQVHLSGEDFYCFDVDMGGACLKAVELLNKESRKELDGLIEQNGSRSHQ